MVYFKSLLAGIAALVIATILSPFVMAIYLRVVYKPAANESIGWDPVSFGKQPFVWVVAAIIYLVGFAWEFRRAASK